MLAKIDQRWRSLCEEILSGMKEWQMQHPRATLREMEQELDKRWSYARARMLEDMAMGNATSEAVDWVCPECGQAGQPRGGQFERRLLTRGGQEIVLERTRGECPACGAGFFPSG